MNLLSLYLALQSWSDGEVYIAIIVSIILIAMIIWAVIGWSGRRGP